MQKISSALGTSIWNFTIQIIFRYNQYRLWWSDCWYHRKCGLNNESSSKLQKLFKEYEKQIVHSVKLIIIGRNILRWLNFNTNLWEVLELATLNYMYIVFQTRNFFFAFNHINYARWLTRYHDNLLKLQETHPTVYAEFKDGLFFIKKTNTSFSGISTDLTLEQTIGADAVCQRIGISAMSNSISARQRWAQSHHIRTSEILHLSESLSITKKEYFTRELKPYNIKNTQRLLKRYCPLLKIIWIRLNSAEKKCTVLLQEQQQTEKQLNLFCFSRNRCISKIKICIRMYKKRSSKCWETH